MRQKKEISSSQAYTPVRLRNAPLIQVSILMLELALVLALALFIAATVPSNPPSSQGSHGTSWLQAILAKPTDSPLPTMMFTPTATPSPLPTATFSPSASAFPTSLPSITPTFMSALLPTDTPQPSTPQPEGEFVAAQLPAGGDKLIVVSIQNQHVYAYQGGTLVYSFIASTGRHNATDAGTYHILDKLPDPYSDPWGFWMPDWMGIYYAGDLENGFHALPILPNGQRLWANDLGTPVSYGCIVLDMQEAQELYNWADVGTTVQINP